MKVRLGLLVAVLVLGSLSCNSNNNSTTVTVGDLYVTTAGNTSVQAYGITLSTGALSTDGPGVGTGGSPSAMALSPDVTTLVVTNASSNNLSIYTVNGDGSVTAVSGNPATGADPVALAFNPQGSLLFVANQNDSTISVYSVSGTTLTEVAGSPFSTVTPGLMTPTSPDALAVSASGNYLYVANNFTSTVSIMNVASSGVLTQSTLPPYNVGLNPTSLGITSTGAFLYVANFSDNNISGFQICDKVTNSCPNPNAPDGSLLATAGSPYSAGIGPIAISTDATGSFLYVADETSNQISQFRISVGSGGIGGTGALSPLTPAAVSTGTTPVGVAVVLGTNTIATTGGTTEYLYVPNNGGTSISTYSFDSTLGQLTVVGMPTPTISGNPSAVAVR